MMLIVSEREGGRFTTYIYVDEHSEDSDADAGEAEKVGMIEKCILAAKFAMLYIFLIILCVCIFYVCSREFLLMDNLISGRVNAKHRMTDLMY